MAPGAPGRSPGRPRDEKATEAILSAALRQLYEVGFGRLSMESVAAEADVSRATVYRRFKGKGDLVTAAVAGNVPRPERGSDQPRRALVRALGEFDERFSESCLEVVGGLLGLREEPDAMALHRQRVVGPRTDYVRSLLEEGVRRGGLAADTDVDLLLELLMGAVFARRVMGVPATPGWAERAVAAVWPAPPD